MRRITFTLALALIAGSMMAQSQASGPAASGGEAAAQAAVSHGSQITAGFSTETRLRLEAMLQAAREDHLPSQPMTDRIAEGRAKGASEAQILLAAHRVEAELKASQQALIRAGRKAPTDQEVSRGAQVIAAGATEAQLEAFVHRAPSDRRLEVALAVLATLAARGVPVNHAIAVIELRLSGGASDGQLVSITASGNGQVNGSTMGGGAASQPGNPDAGPHSANGSPSSGSNSGSLGATVAGSLTSSLGVSLVRKP